MISCIVNPRHVNVFSFSESYDFHGLANVRKKIAALSCSYISDRQSIVLVIVQLLCRFLLQSFS